MDDKIFKKFLAHLLKNYSVFSTREEDGKISIAEIINPDEIALSKKLPFYSWKKFFVPEKETLFEFGGAGKKTGKPVALLGVNHVDLGAVNLYDKVFADDPYYQKRMDNTLIIGYGCEIEMFDNSVRAIAEDDLRHLRFDVFLADDRDPFSGNFNVFTGSERSKEVLNKIKYTDYKEIKFESHKYAPEWDKKMSLRREKLKNHHNPEIWEKLGKICIECGKCTIACPTCFCFRIDDISKNADRQRCWDSCFYHEFSEVAGPSTSSGQAEKPKFLNSTAERIHFWYYHKFGRIPDEYNMMGCVGCGRCHQVCPVEINIKEVMEQIENS